MAKEVGTTKGAGGTQTPNPQNNRSAINRCPRNSNTVPPEQHAPGTACPIPPKHSAARTLCRLNIMPPEHYAPRKPRIRNTMPPEQSNQYGSQPMLSRTSISVEKPIWPLSYDD